ncbi:MAG: GNAT family N-acetyltransferase [Ignavibacterium sp.]|nr:GNAT family N-acetyltransferase [Ignavibacterium sp.]
MTNNLIIRFAEKSDTPIIFSLIKQLAEYEKLLDKVITTEERIKQSIFGNNQFIEVLIAEFEGKAVGYALFFKNYSTFLGKAGIYLEDLFVLPDYRGKGIGKSLLKKIISIAKQRDYGRVEWSVLDWNVSAIEIYKKIGAEPLDEWKIFRLTSDKL